MTVYQLLALRIEDVGDVESALIAALRGAPSLLPREIANTPAVLQAEMRALRNLNVPRFVALAGTQCLALGSGQLLARRFLPEKPARGVRQRLEGLSAAAVERVHLPALGIAVLAG